MLEPSNINKYARKDPEDILYDNLYKKFGQRFVEYRKRYSDNIKYLDLEKKTTFPNTVILELVNRCDLECVMCYQGFRNDTKKVTLDDTLLDKIFSEFVEPHLNDPIFVTDYPKAISPLAKEDRNGNADIVERFELFIAGMEFANAFSELNDPIEQRNRLEAQAKLRDSGDEEAQIVDENFLQAIEIGMPPTGGVGIGVDRLVMLLTQQESIKDVILFPAMRHEDK